MLTLGIETSCDETAVALYHDEQGLITHAIHSQTSVHQPYGGVIPELASRDHIHKLVSMVDQLLERSGYNYQDLSGIAYTAGPGLMGALLVGASFAKGLAYSLNKPALGIHHLEAHLMAPFLEPHSPQFPFLGLLVSGGHTFLIHVYALGHYKILGETLDDSVGEAFDKTAKMFGLPYPGGPELAKIAEQGRESVFNFPRPMLHSKDLNFSFSGLKTHVMQAWKKSLRDESVKADMAHAFQEAIAEVLVTKTKKALENTGLTQVVIAGGVSANTRLRETLFHTLGACTEIFYPRLEFCTDNAAMVAYTGHRRIQAGQREDLEILCRSRWSMEELSQPVS